MTTNQTEFDTQMKIKGIKYEFTATTWKSNGPGGWHFISLPGDLAKEIRGALRSEEEGWGRLKATARIGSSEWRTAIWFDTKINTYLLPIKAGIRQSENITFGKNIEAIIWI